MDFTSSFRHQQIIILMITFFLLLQRLVTNNYARAKIPKRYAHASYLRVSRGSRV
jgi:hypothetical protein